MPLIILGLIVIISIVIYAHSDDRDTRPVRERYAPYFEKMKKAADEKFRKGANYTVVEDEEEDDDDPGNKGDGHTTMYFPTDAESEKRKRNIH